MANNPYDDGYGNWSSASSNASFGADIIQKLAAQQKKAVAPPPLKVDAPPPADDDSILPTVVCHPFVPGPLMVVLVGAGGNGARVLPPMMQMLRANDRVVVVDHDIVEERNLLRQHFTRRDIGSPKALVLAERYRRPDIAVGAVQDKLEPLAVPKFTQWDRYIAATAGGTHVTPTAVIYIGCVDSNAARAAIQHHVNASYSHTGIPHAWIDVGNDMRGGQVLLSLPNWTMTSTVWTRPAAGKLSKCNMQLDGIGIAMPQMLRTSKQEAQEASCGERLDFQTVQVNMMAASAAVNMLGGLLMGLPFQTAGAFFNTANVMSPIKLSHVSGSRIVPDDRYAIQA